MLVAQKSLIQACDFAWMGVIESGRTPRRKASETTFCDIGDTAYLTAGSYPGYCMDGSRREGRLSFLRCIFTTLIAVELFNSVVVDRYLRLQPQRLLC